MQIGTEAVRRETEYISLPAATSRKFIPDICKTMLPESIALSEVG
jgi:hypothetical protein